jgi:hypothetical protein
MASQAIKLVIVVNDLVHQILDLGNVEWRGLSWEARQCRSG